jgi:hypothetical protein
VEKPPGNVFDLLRDLEALDQLEPVHVPKEKRKKPDLPPPPPPSYHIPFNTTNYDEKAGDGEAGSSKLDSNNATKDFVEIMEVLVNCEHCNNQFFDSIKAGTQFPSPPPPFSPLLPPSPPSPSVIRADPPKSLSIRSRRGKYGDLLQKRRISD